MSDVASWLNSHGLKVDHVELDGEFHRVDGKKNGRKAGWYKGWETPIRVCVAGDWSTGQTWEWRASGLVSKEDMREIRRRQSETAAAAEKERLGIQAAVAAEVRGTLSLAELASRDHPYLVAKSIAPHGTFEARGTLYVPNIDVDGIIWGAQKITRDGKKFWHKGQRVAATFFQIGELGSRAFICEGFATGASIHQVSGAAVFCAFSANNLKPVALILKAKYPSIEWTIAADNDAGTDGNPGLANAEDAARAVGCSFVYPTFSELKAGTDFNDLMLIEGPDVVRRQLVGDERPMAKVTDIGKSKRKPPKTASGTDRVGRAELFYLIAMKMNGAGPAEWPAFPTKFHYVADRAGRKAVLEELDDQVVAYRDKDAVADAILKYCWEGINFIPEAMAVDAEGAAKCRNMWLSLTPELKERPTILLEKSTPGLTFKRLPFDAPPCEPDKVPPHFESLLALFTPAIPVCAYIGSLFYPDSYRQQYLYLYGEGGDGKGALMRFLCEIFGDAAVSLSPPGANERRFWNFNLFGRRLGLFFDCDDGAWFKSPHFKSLTGGDPIFYEQKGRDGFTDVCQMKFIAASNAKPTISSQSADLRRLIYVSCKSLPEEDRTNDFEKLLLEEAEAIIRTCKAIYLQQAPDHGPVPFDPATEIALESESQYLDLFHTHFALGEGFKVMGDAVSPVLRKAGLSDREVKQVKAVWERQLGVKITHSKTGTVYDGMHFKAAMVARGDNRDN